MLHPAAVAGYKQQVLDLEAALNDPNVKQEASNILRSLIAQVALTRNVRAGWLGCRATWSGG